MTSHSKINPNSGHGTDSKYSIWRREMYPLAIGRRDHYALDIDWVEWRNHRAVALLETKRVMPGKDPLDVVAYTWRYQGGFELEVLATFSQLMKVPAFIVAIEDPHPAALSYGSATFTVVKVNLPPEPIRSYREPVKTLVSLLSPEETMNYNQYVEFLRDLG